jgi:hypothetical protein
VQELGTRDPSKVKKVLTEPDLLLVRLVVALSDYLLYRVLLLALLVLAQPHQRKPAPSQQLHLIIPVRKPVPKRLHLLVAHVIRVFLLPLPLYVDLFYRLCSLRLEPAVAFLWVVAFFWASNGARFFNLLRVVVEVCVKNAFFVCVGLLE